MNALQIPAAAESSSAHQGQISDAAEIDLRRVAAAQVIRADNSHQNYL